MNKNLLAAIAVIVAVLAAVLMFTIWSNTASSELKTAAESTVVQEVEEVTAEPQEGETVMETIEVESGVEVEQEGVFTSVEIAE